jgi:hypothetical protein
VRALAVHELPSQMDRRLLVAELTPCRAAPARRRRACGEQAVALRAAPRDPRRMRKSTNDIIVEWCVPILAGPFIGASAFATLKAILYIFHGGIGLWIVYILLAIPLAIAQVIVFAAVDIALLRAKLRALPTGRPAWWMAIAAPMLVGLATGLFPKPQPEPGPAFIGVIIMLIAIVPMIVITIAMRLIFGKPPGAE